MSAALTPRGLVRNRNLPPPPPQILGAQAKRVQRGPQRASRMFGCRRARRTTAIETVPAFAHFVRPSLNIYVVVVERRRKRRGGDYRASACDAVISRTRSAPFDDLHHRQCAFFLQETTR